MALLESKIPVCKSYSKLVLLGVHHRLQFVENRSANVQGI